MIFGKKISAKELTEILKTLKDVTVRRGGKAEQQSNQGSKINVGNLLTLPKEVKRDFSITGQSPVIKMKSSKSQVTIEINLPYIKSFQRQGGARTVTDVYSGIEPRGATREVNIPSKTVSVQEKIKRTITGTKI